MDYDFVRLIRYLISNSVPSIAISCFIHHTVAIISRTEVAMQVKSYLPLDELKRLVLCHALILGLPWRKGTVIIGTESNL